MPYSWICCLSCGLTFSTYAFLGRTEPHSLALSFCPGITLTTECDLIFGLSQNVTTELEPGKVLGHNASKGPHGWAGNGMTCKLGTRLSS